MLLERRIENTDKEDIGVESPGGGVRVGEEVPESLRFNSLQESVSLDIITSIRLSDSIGEVSMRGKLYSHAWSKFLKSS